MRRVEFDERTFDEAWFQRLLFEHPSLLPIEAIEGVFAPLIPLAREVGTDAGPIDVVYVSPEGYLTLVETKLFRNPEARREVVAQIIDYATAMSRWTYSQLRDAVKKAGGSGDDPVIAAAEKHPDFDKASFIDTVSRNLREGRFLLLIVGDGIQEGVEALAETLARSPRLRFELALVELALFRPAGQDLPIYVQPSVLARTREVVRAVVEVRGPSKVDDIEVTAPTSSESSGGGTRLRLTEEAFLEKLTAATSKKLVDDFRTFLEEVGKRDIETQGNNASVSLLWYDPSTDRRFSFGSVYCENGAVNFSFVPHNFRKANFDEHIGLRYVSAVASLVPGAAVRPGVKEGKSWPRVFVGHREVALADLLPHSAGWLKALDAAISETESAAAAKAGGT
jgi:hypothetical protein